mmetsp:Transcript_29086/g.70214  ORF Transcript_29086/g.70214 Transcript_29086/m.70214 type:complete len:210 (-) Transcript_29086:1201-1830(-)
MFRPVALAIFIVTSSVAGTETLLSGLTGIIGRGVSSSFQIQVLIAPGAFNGTATSHADRSASAATVQLTWCSTVSVLGIHISKAIITAHASSSIQDVVCTSSSSSSSIIGLVLVAPPKAKAAFCLRGRSVVRGGVFVFFFDSLFGFIGTRLVLVFFLFSNWAEQDQSLFDTKVGSCQILGSSSGHFFHLFGSELFSTKQFARSLAGLQF